jgi:serine phosphatase RsbU (regulator of sigma subunit)
LFTDGLVEVRGGSLTDGLDRVQQTVASFGDPRPEALCDELLAYVSRQTLRDDVALLVVRLLPSSVAVPV